jgi:hypothetical protein
VNVGGGLPLALVLDLAGEAVYLPDPLLEGADLGAHGGCILAGKQKAVETRKTRS